MVRMRDITCGKITNGIIMMHIKFPESIDILLNCVFSLLHWQCTDQLSVQTDSPAETDNIDHY